MRKSVNGAAAYHLLHDLWNLAETELLLASLVLINSSIGQKIGQDAVGIWASRVGLQRTDT